VTDSLGLGLGTVVPIGKRLGCRHSLRPRPRRLVTVTGSITDCLVTGDVWRHWQVLVGVGIRLGTGGMPVCCRPLASHSPGLGAESADSDFITLPELGEGYKYRVSLRLPSLIDMNLKIHFNSFQLVEELCFVQKVCAKIFLTSEFKFLVTKRCVVRFNRSSSRRFRLRVRLRVRVPSLRLRVRVRGPARDRDRSDSEISMQKPRKCWAVVRTEADRRHHRDCQPSEKPASCYDERKLSHSTSRRSVRDRKVLCNDVLTDWSMFFA